MRLFVYGTLRAGEPRHDLLGAARALGAASTGEGWRLEDLGTYPGLVASATGRVVGELYEVELSALGRLDDSSGGSSSCPTPASPSRTCIAALRTAAKCHSATGPAAAADPSLPRRATAANVLA